MKFKQLAFAAAVLAAPFMAQADMTAMDDGALSGVTGQAGISISGDFSGSIGAMVYTDTDAATGGELRLETITFTGFAIDDADPLTVDVNANKLEIGLPSMTGEVKVGAIRVGGAAASSIGSLALSNIDMGGTTIKVWGH
ncbi:MAG TPA: DUF6160 family protein [Pseudomonas sp.]|uniref:DUF6160 family protein n=1 Tax=Pseudomonas sp. TaxID=306 RepID=UPI002C3DB10F|nr:DUF6160 family protein [Pseudomonas sp.]HRL92257.1 DUF6160 family protein [Pseudomonas sp.]